MRNKFEAYFQTLLDWNPKYIYKILDNNKIDKIEVVTGVRKDGNLEILEGLKENDKIVKEGLSRLSKGMTVKPIIK